MVMPERQLILYWNEVKKGNKEAFNSLYFATIDAVYAYAWGFIKDESLIDDTIQEVYARMWLSRDKIIIHSSLKGYLLKTLRRDLLKSVRKRRKMLAVDFEAADYFTPSTEKQIIREEMNAYQDHQLKLAISTLSPRQKEAIYLKFFLQMEYQAISEAMQIQESAIYKLISNALSRLRLQLQKKSKKDSV